MKLAVVRRRYDEVGVGVRSCQTFLEDTSYCFGCRLATARTVYWSSRLEHDRLLLPLDDDRSIDRLIDCRSVHEITLSDSTPVKHIA